MRQPVQDPREQVAPGAVDPEPVARGRPEREPDLLALETHLPGPAVRLDRQGRHPGRGRARPHAPGHGLARRRGPRLPRLARPLEQPPVVPEGPREGPGPAGRRAQGDPHRRGRPGARPEGRQREHRLRAVRPAQDPFEGGLRLVGEAPRDGRPRVPRQGPALVEGQARRRAVVHAQVGPGRRRPHDPQLAVNVDGGRAHRGLGAHGHDGRERDVRGPQDLKGTGGHGRPQHPVRRRAGEQRAAGERLVVRPRLPAVAQEAVLRVVAQHGEVRAALETHVQRLVVADELRPEAHGVQQGQRAEGEPRPLHLAEPAPALGRHGVQARAAARLRAAGCWKVRASHGPQRWKLIRGSIST